MDTSSPNHAACPTCCLNAIHHPITAYTPPPHLHQTFMAMLPVGRQCHHSAASSSARLNTGPEVQTAARAGRCAITHRHSNKTACALTHTKSLRFTCLLFIHTQTNLLRQSMWRRAWVFIGNSWYLSGD